jgi:hypothetical protein
MPTRIGCKQYYFCQQVILETIVSLSSAVVFTKNSFLEVFETHILYYFIIGCYDWVVSRMSFH